MKRTDETINLSSSKQGKVSKTSDDTCVSSKDENASEGKSVKDVLKEKLLVKRHCPSLNLKQRTQLKEWCIYLKNLRYACDIISLTEKHSPLLYERNERCPDSALVVFPCHIQRKNRTISACQTADFRWRFLAFPVYHLRISGVSERPVKFNRFCRLASRWFSSSHTLCLRPPTRIHSLRSDFSDLFVAVISFTTRRNLGKFRSWQRSQRTLLTGVTAVLRHLELNCVFSELVECNLIG